VGRDPTDALVLAVAGPLTLVQLIGGVHNEAVMIGLLAAGLAVGLGGRPPTSRGRGDGRLVAGVILCALGAAVKVPAFAGVVVLGWRGDGASAPLVRRLIRTALASAIGVVTIELVSLVTGAGWGWLHGVNAGSNVTTLLSVSTTIGLVLNWLAGQPRHSLHGPVAAVRALVLAAGAAAAVVLLWRVPRRPLAAALAALGIALTVVALAGASVQPWYLAWGLPALAVALAGRPARAWLIGAVVAAASTQPKGGGLVRNLGSFHGPALVGLVLLAAGAVVYARRRLRPPPLAQLATRSA
jgi:alpha-1,6-mannosyltransferase